MAMPPYPIVRLMAGALLAAGAAHAAAAQGKDDNWLSRLFQPPAATSVPAPAPAAGTREWSGQPGASGHPLMTADAIRAAAADFSICLGRLWPDAARRGVYARNL